MESLLETNTNWLDITVPKESKMTKPKKQKKLVKKAKRRGRPPGSKNKSVPTIVGKRGRPKQNITFADTLANINLLAKQLEMGLIAAIKSLKDL